MDVTTLDTSTIFLIAAIFIILIVVLLYWRQRAADPSRVLRAYSSSDDDNEKGNHPLVVGSWEHKARLAFGRLGIDVAGMEAFAVAGFYLVLATLIAAGLGLVMMLPTLVTILGALIGAGFGLAVALNKAWDRMQRELEKELPTLMIRLSGMIQAAPNVLESLDQVTQSLDPDKPLRTWMARLVHSAQAEGTSAFDAMEKEATVISPALVLAVVQIRRLWQSGGSGYVDAFRMVAEHLSELMNTRAMAYAKAGRGSNLALLIVGAASLSLTVILRGGTTRDLFLANPVSRLGLVAYFLWGGLGWFYIRSILKSVTG
jgi:Flp pilus assembly protein TadB